MCHDSCNTRNTYLPPKRALDRKKKSDFIFRVNLILQYYKSDFYIVSSVYTEVEGLKDVILYVILCRLFRITNHTPKAYTLTVREPLKC